MKSGIVGVLLAFAFLDCGAQEFELGCGSQQKVSAIVSGAGISQSDATVQRCVKEAADAIGVQTLETQSPSSNTVFGNLLRQCLANGGSTASVDYTAIRVESGCR